MAMGVLPTTVEEVEDGSLQELRPTMPPLLVAPIRVPVDHLVGAMAVEVAIMMAVAAVQAAAAAIAVVQAEHSTGVQVEVAVPTMRVPVRPVQPEVEVETAGLQ